MSEEPKNEPDLVGELKSLGDNLIDVLRATWERPERQQIKKEIENGLVELNNALKKAADEVRSSELGAKVKTSYEQVKSRVESGEVEQSLRQELGSAVKSLNYELNRLIEILRQPSVKTDSAPAAGEPAEPGKE